MQTTPTSVQGHPAKPPTSQSYPTSVPLYVYRQLATELQLTQVKLETITSQNHQLERENQLLRQEITKVVQSFSHLQNYVNTGFNPSHPQATRATAEASSPAPVVNQTSHHPEFSTPVEINHQIPQTFYIEEQPVNHYPPMEKKVKELSSWWLAMNIVLLMLTAFGAAYLIVPLLFEAQNP